MKWARLLALGNAATPVRFGTVCITASLLAGFLLPTPCAARAPPGPLSSLLMRNHPIVAEWSEVPAAQTYDVVVGDLVHLRSKDGEFTAATLGCLASETTVTSAAFNATPSPGQGFWILVRGSNVSGHGTYDTGEAGQAGSRDAEIDASPLSCANQSGCG